LIKDVLSWDLEAEGKPFIVVLVL